MEKSKSYKITSEFENVNFISSQVRKFLCEDLPDQTPGNEIEMCLIEALNNIVKHAYKLESGNLIEIEATLNENGAANILLIDSGNPRPTVEKATLEFDPTDIENLPEGGMGLYIIEELMDETEYYTEGNKNYYKMVKDLN